MYSGTFALRVMDNRNSSRSRADRGPSADAPIAFHTMAMPTVGRLQGWSVVDAVPHHADQMAALLAAVDPG